MLSPVPRHGWAELWRLNLVGIRGWARRVAYLSVLTLIASLVPTDGALATAGLDAIPAVEAEQIPADSVGDLDVSLERAIVEATGEPVEVLQARTEDDFSTFVNPLTARCIS